MKDMQAQIAGLVRHILTFGGGYVVGQGMMDASTWEQLSGALATLAGLVWSFWHKSRVQPRHGGEP